MNYRLQLSPICTRDSQPSESWDVPPLNWEDMKVFRSWLVYDSDVDPDRSRGIDWNAVMGLAVAVTVSATFWTGLGFTLAYFLQ
jgi:hypothetical protein